MKVRLGKLELEWRWGGPWLLCVDTQPEPLFTLLTWCAFLGPLGVYWFGNSQVLLWGVSKS
jgi:hypothetical protein